MGLLGHSVCAFQMKHVDCQTDLIQLALFSKTIQNDSLDLFTLHYFETLKDIIECHFLSLSFYFLGGGVFGAGLL